MNRYHKELLKEIGRYAGKPDQRFDPQSYLGSNHKHYHLSNPVKRGIASVWVKEHKEIELSEFVALLESLYGGRSYEEKTLASMLLESAGKLRKQVNPELLDGWLEHLEGWAEIDSLCQSNFTADELLSNWPTWKKLLIGFNKSKNIGKRRASLVLLCKSVRQSDDRRLADLAFCNIDRVKSEKDKLITKAVSWLLRELIKNHRDQVDKYLDDNEDTLPKIAIRETRKKLETGKK